LFMCQERRTFGAAPLIARAALAKHAFHCAAGRLTAVHG
jgi:hypothetical protein